MQVSVKYKIGKVTVTKYGEFIIDNIKITAVPFNAVYEASSFTKFSPTRPTFSLNPLNLDIGDNVGGLSLKDDLKPERESEVIVDWVSAELFSSGMPI